MEKEEGFRICSHCGEEMIEGYCINGGEEHYCNEECLGAVYTQEEIENFDLNKNGANFWKSWYEDGE